MKALINHHIDLKTSIYATRFLSSLISLQTPSQNPSNLSTTFDPYHFLNESTKSRNYTLQETKIIHAHFLRTINFHSNPDFSNFLLRSYSKASAFDYALKVFDEMPHPDISSWNLIITCHNKNLRYTDSWKTFCRLQSLGFYPNEFTYGSAISAFIALNHVIYGKLLYSHASKHGFSLDGYVRSGMIDLFLKSGSFNDALKVFHDESCGNVVCWNSIISGAIKHNQDYVGLNLFQQMCRGSPSPNKFTFPSVFGACGKNQELEFGQQIHGLVVKYGQQEDIVVDTAIVDFYAKCGQTYDALKTFSRMSVRNVVSWTVVITGFAQKGEFESAIKLFKEMIILKEDINSYTVTSVLSACTNSILSQIHCWIYKTGFYSDPTVKNSLINSYSKTGSIKSSEKVFKDTKDLTNPSTFAAMISGFCQNGDLENAFNLLNIMLREGLIPDKSCIPSLLSIINCLKLGEQIHCYTLKTGIFFNHVIGCSLFTMYSKCGCLNKSYDIFKQIPEKDNVSWASMIVGFTENGFAYKAVELFREMVIKNMFLDETTLSAVLTACSSIRGLMIGKEIHGFFIKNEDKKQDKKPLYGGNSIVNMYSRCGDSKSAKKVFDKMDFKDSVSCSSLFSGYAQNGEIENAFILFLDLISSGLEVDSYTISSVLGILGDLDHSDIGIRFGIQLHCFILKLGFESDPSVGSSLVKMYSKYGNLVDCRNVFDQINGPDLISWTTMINGYAQHGKGLEALKVYDLMIKSGTKPDSVTFIGVLTACSHSGLVDQGYCYLKSMVKDYGIDPGQRHYACMVDVLGRNGKLKEAERFIKSMPIEADYVVWGSLLANCKVYGDVEIGKLAAEKFVELAPKSDGGYVAFSNICADVGQWEEVVKIRNEMRGNGVKKQVGWSYV